MYAVLCLKKKSEINALIKKVNPAGVKLNENKNFSLERVNLKNKISKYHQVTLFMSEIGNFYLF